MIEGKTEGRILSKTSIRRLNLIADATERGAHPGNFNMTVWDCGYAACAIGNACRDEKVQAEGLFLSNTSPEFRFSRGAVAITEFCDISMTEAGYLFTGRVETSREEVVARIRQFIADHSPEVVEGELTREQVKPVTNKELVGV